MSEKFFFVFIFELFITDSFFIAGIVFLIILDTAIFTWLKNNSPATVDKIVHLFCRLTAGMLLGYWFGNQVG